MNFSPEARLIIALAGQDMTQEQERTARELITGSRPEFNWPLFADQAAQHRVGPLISRQLRRLHAADRHLEIDQSVTGTLRALEFYHADRNKIMLAGLGEVLAAAGESSLTVIPRKGGHLAQVAYREPGLRPMGDLDLLVAPEQVDPFVAVLERLGYKQGLVRGNSVQPLARREQIFWRLYGSDLPKFNKLTGSPTRPVISIDVNVALVLPGKGHEIPLTDVLDRAATGTSDGRPARFLAPEDTVLDLCAHIYKNSTGLRFMHLGKHRRLIKYVDVVEYLNSHAGVFSWDVLTDRAIRYDLAGPVFFALAHLDLLFPGRVPEPVLEKLRARCPDPELLLRQYGQWDLSAPRQWTAPFGERFFRRDDDRDIPASRSLV